MSIKGEFDIRYSDDQSELIAVPAITTITIIRSCRVISGSSNTNYAFSGAANSLQTVSFESGSLLETISTFSFYKCKSLNEMDLSKCDHLELIGDEAFNGCSSLSVILLPANVKKLGEKAFSYTAITSFHITVGVTFLGDGLFDHAESLTTVTFDPQIKVKTAEHHLFANTAIVDVTFPKVFPSIVGNMFNNCFTCMNVNVADGNSKYKSIDGFVMTQNGESLVYVPAGRTEPFRIPDGVIRLETCCFICTRSNTITFSDNVSYVGSWGFSQAAIKTIDLPASIRTLDRHAFSYCTGLTSIVLPEGLETVASSCFFKCSNLKSVIIPSTLKSLGGGAFTNCHADLTVSFDPESDFDIDSQFLITNRGKTEIVQYIGTEKAVSISDTISVIKEKAFYGLGIETITFGPNPILERILSQAFEHCSKLKNFQLPSSVSAIECRAFFGCDSLQSISFGPNFNSMQREAFMDCSILKSAIFQNSFITNIEFNAFKNCPKLSTVTLSTQLQNIHHDAFAYCTSLTTITLPTSIQTIGSKAFSFCGLTEAIFDNSNVEIFEESLFFNCSNLERIVFPTVIKTISHRALAYTKLTDVVLPESVVNLNDFCFEGCDQLVKFSVPKTSKLEVFGYGVFSKCMKLEEIDINNDNFVIGLYGLFNRNKTKFYAFPPSAPSKHFSFPSGVESIESGALMYCGNLEYIFLPATITRIGTSSFQGCKSLKSINIPSGITYIGPNAFLECPKLICDLSIEDTSEEFLKKLTDAKLPERCIKPCYCHTLKMHHYGFCRALSCLVALVLESV